MPKTKTSKHKKQYKSDKGRPKGKVNHKPAHVIRESCQLCNNPATTTCKYCNRKFCGTHAEPILSQSYEAIIRLTETDRRRDPELYEKRNTDWARDDGHPDAEFTVFWLKDHEARRTEALQHPNTYQEPKPYYTEPHDNPVPVHVPPKEPIKPVHQEPPPPKSNHTQQPGVKEPKPDYTTPEQSSTATPNRKTVFVVLTVATVLLLFLILSDTLPLYNQVPVAATPSISISNQSPHIEALTPNSLLLMKSGSIVPVNSFPNSYYGVRFTVPNKTNRINITGSMTSNESVEILLFNQSEFDYFTANGRSSFGALSKVDIKRLTNLKINIAQPGNYYLLFFNPYNTSGAYTNVTIVTPLTLIYSANITTTSTTSTTTTSIPATSFPTTTVQSTTTPQNNYLTDTITQQSELTMCVSNVNSDLNIAQDKLPSGTLISIVNETVFSYNLNNNFSINYVNNWIAFWNSGYTFSGTENCNGDPGFYACRDSAGLYSEINDSGPLSSGDVIGAGMAVKFDFPPQAQSNGWTEVSPVICDATGSVMSNSNNYLRTKTSYT